LRLIVWRIGEIPGRARKASFSERLGFALTAAEKSKFARLLVFFDHLQFPRQLVDAGNGATIVHNPLVQRRLSWTGISIDAWSAVYKQLAKNQVKIFP
jgi:hypothetical protein